MMHTSLEVLLLFVAMLSMLDRMTYCVSVSVELKDQPPQMKANYDTSIVAEVATTARIICPVYGTEDRKPLVTWTRNGNLVHIGWDRYRTSRAGLTLLIDNVQEFDNGVYTCSASNGFGTVTVSLELTVLSSANFTAYGRESTTHQPPSRDPAMTSSKDKENDSPAMVFNDIDVRVEPVTSSIPINALDDTEYDVIMTSLLCMGSAVVLTSLGALIATAARRRIKYRSERRVMIPELLSGQRLIAGAAALNTRGDKQSCLYYPTATITSCSTLIGPQWTERHNEVDHTASPAGRVAMEAASELCHNRRCGACVERGLKERPAADQRTTSNGVRLTLTWPQAAVDCDSSNCYCSTLGSLDSCASI